MKILEHRVIVSTDCPVLGVIIVIAHQVENHSIHNDFPEVSHGNRKTLTKKLSYADYLAWKDDQRWEIIDGAPLLMFPAPNRIHQTIIKKIAFQIESYVQDKTCELFFSPFDVRLEPPEIDNDKAFHVGSTGFTGGLRTGETG